MKKQSEANEAAWIQTKAKLEDDWRLFEAEVKKYVESFGKQIEHQQATFKLQADAQLKAWREAADELGGDAKKFASERRGDIDAAVKRMNADAVEAEKKLEKLSQAGTQSWSALMAALTETRTAFDRANEAGSVQASCLIEHRLDSERPLRGGLSFLLDEDQEMTFGGLPILARTGPVGP